MGKQEKKNFINIDYNKALEELKELERENDLVEDGLNGFKNSLSRRFYAILQELKRKEDYTKINFYINNKKLILEEMASLFGNSVFNSYINLEQQLNKLIEDKSFKDFILNKSLNKIYKIKNNYLSKKDREKNSSIEEHLCLTDEGILFLYKHYKEKDFDELIFEALNNDINIFYKDYGKISLINTFNKGKWLRFSGGNNLLEYENSVKGISIISRNTPWCTQYVARSQLKDGELYVFLNKSNIPKIIIKVTDNKIDKVRGVKEGSQQFIDNNLFSIVTEFMLNSATVLKLNETKSSINKKLKLINKYKIM